MTTSSRITWVDQQGVGQQRVELADLAPGGEFFLADMKFSGIRGLELCTLRR